MKRSAVGIPCLMVLLSFSASSSASTPQVSLAEEVCRADAILVGRLMEIQENYLSVISPDPKFSAFQLDLGRISVERRLKALTYLPDDAVHVFFQSKAYEKDASGIWFLRWDGYASQYVVLRNYSGRDPFPIPIESEPEIASLVKEMKCDFPPKYKLRAAIR